jgi:hypothetical protein
MSTRRVCRLNSQLQSHVVFMQRGSQVVTRVPNCIAKTTEQISTEFRSGCPQSYVHRPISNASLKYHSCPVCPCRRGTACSRYGGANRLTLCKQRGQPTRDGPPAWGLSGWTNNSSLTCYERSHRTTLRPRRRWEDNIKNVRQEIKWKCVDWTYAGQDSDRCWGLVETVMNFWFHKRGGGGGQVCYY